MTDNEIIKALECCIAPNCAECPIFNNSEIRNVPGRCVLTLEKEALSLINRQQAEIEGLKIANEKLYWSATQAPKEAIKECFDWVLSLFPTDKSFTTISRFSVNQKLKEMVGDD